ncbi:MAG: DUF2634 domain-containing protein [Eubacteriales bacterium]|nr:DUF2634 domain-containing protein [Eubacteriales bacterium]
MAIGYSLLWDDETGDFMLVDGGLVLAEGELSVCEWLACNIGVEEDKHPIYEDTGIGVPLGDLIGAKGAVPMGTIMAVLSTKIEETALLCPDVASVGNIRLERQGGTAHLTMTVQTTGGETVEEEAEIDL